MTMGRGHLAHAFLDIGLPISHDSRGQISKKSGRPTDFPTIFRWSRISPSLFYHSLANHQIKIGTKDEHEFAKIANTILCWALFIVTHAKSSLLQWLLHFSPGFCAQICGSNNKTKCPPTLRSSVHLKFYPREFYCFSHARTHQANLRGTCKCVISFLASCEREREMQ